MADELRDVKVAIQAMDNDLEPADTFAVGRKVAGASADEYDLVVRTS